MHKNNPNDPNLFLVDHCLHVWQCFADVGVAHVGGWLGMHGSTNVLGLGLAFHQFSNALALVKPTIVCRVINHVFV